MEKEEEREDGDSYRTLVVITVGEVVLEAQKMGSSRPPHSKKVRSTKINN